MECCGVINRSVNIFVYSTLGMYPVLNNLNICYEKVKFLRLQVRFIFILLTITDQ